MITFILAMLAIGLLQISVTYRHALLFAKSSVGKILWVSLVLTVMNVLMAWVAFVFADSFRDSMFFEGGWAAFGILLILAFKAYFNTRRSKLADNVFDITQFRMLFFLGLATSFEVFIAVMGAAMIETDLLTSVLIAAAVSFVFSLFGLLAGRRPGHLSSIRVFILFASLFYLFAALSTLFFLL